MMYTCMLWMQLAFGLVDLGRIHLPLNKTLMDDKSVKWAINTYFFVFHPILMKFGEVVVHMGTTTSLSFIKIGLVKIKKFYI